MFRSHFFYNANDLVNSLLQPELTNFNIPQSGPMVQVIESPDKYRAIMLVPNGTDIDKINIQASKKGLILSGEFNSPDELKENESIYYNEIYTKFNKQICLKEIIDVDAVNARLSGNYLEIILPKSKASNIKQIKIDA